MPQLARELLLWVPVGAIPIVDGAIRLATYQSVRGETAAGWVSAGLDILFILTYAISLAPARRVAIRVAIWLTATTLLHFVLGGLVLGVPIAELLGKYDVLAGEAWAPVNLAIAAGPWIGERIRERQATA